MNKPEKIYMIKKWENSSLRTENVVPSSPIDTFSIDHDSSHSLSALIVNCQSLVSKKESFQNFNQHALSGCYFRHRIVA